MNKESNFTHIIIPVPYTGFGNVITNKLVVFRVQQDDQHYIATPFISQEERRLTNLPKEMFFALHNQTLSSSSGSYEGNSDVLADIVRALKEKSFLV